MHDIAKAQSDKLSVYVVNFQGDATKYAGAEAYGDLIFMFRGFIPLDDVDKLVAKIRSYAIQATAADFILLSGPNLVCALVVSEWLSIYKEARILQWDGKQYNVIHLHHNEREEI